MQKLLLAFIGLLALAAVARPLLSAPTAQDETLIERLDWLAGRWVLDEEAQYLEETWSPAREDALVGSLRWARKGEVWLYELMSIEADEELGLVFRLRHFNRGLEPWDSEKSGPLTYPLHDLGDDYVVFEDPERDAPRRFVYRRSGERLTIRLEDPDGVDEAPFEFSLER